MSVFISKYLGMKYFANLAFISTPTKTNVIFLVYIRLFRSPKRRLFTENG